jgi:DENN (AEX-3) domain
MGCLLQETRVALVSKHYALLGPVAEALLSLLFPFHWQGMYLPIMPYNMLEILDAPVPYLVGLHSRFLAEIPVDRRPQGVVVVDLDRDEVHLGIRDDSQHARNIPSLPERHAMKLKAKLVEFAACAYVLPNTQRVGFITTGWGEELPPSERDSYAQPSTSEIPSKSTTRRRDIFPNTDKAYRDNELLVPISGFLSEHGQLYQRETVADSREKRGKFQLKINRAKKNGVEESPSAHNDPHHNGNLLDLNEVRKKQL